MTRSAAPLRPATVEVARPGTGRRLGWILLVGGAVGLIAAFALAVEKYRVLADPGYVPSCSINPVISCGSVMNSAYAAALGFPNPLLGVVGFTVVTVSGVLLLGGVTLPRWYRFGLQIGATVGVVFVHWLIFVSLYRIGALCPYCMVVWAVTIVIFWYVTLDTAADLTARRPRHRSARVVETVRSLHSVVVVAWFAVITTAVLQAFWLYWTTLLP